MASLHQVSDSIKNVVKFVIIVILVLGVLYGVVRGGFVLKEIFSPTPPPPPTVSFGKLPAITFQKSPSGGAFSYVKDTLTGTLPVLPDRVKVYKILQYEPNLLATQRAQEKVANIGFLSPGTPLSPIIYTWEDQILPNRKLELNILTYNFTLTSSFRASPEVLVANNLPNETGAKARAQEFLSGFSVFPEDLDTEKTKTTLFAVQNNELVPATSLSTAQVIRVDFFQKDIDSHPILYPKPDQSTMNIFVGGGEKEAQIVEANFFHHTVMSDSATYPIKSTEQAFKELQAGNAYIASYKGSETTIAIKKVYLAYYVDANPARYLLPIIVFEGSDSFFAYLPAITDSWIEN